MTIDEHSRTPYDTGARLEPIIWACHNRVTVDDFGKVDFDTAENFTLATLWIERTEDGAHALRGHHNEPLAIKLVDQSGTDEQAGNSVPSKALRDKLRQIIEGLRTS
jgi:hypothetical protein